MKCTLNATSEFLSERVHRRRRSSYTLRVDLLHMHCSFPDNALIFGLSGSLKNQYNSRNASRSKWLSQEIFPGRTSCVLHFMLGI
ncbi:hypothetical protein EUGRSUZ_F03354 [Eucalyptus grandis]|uniref:Uncharacterized protein n=2 Tax=Eucalyptus grandis TaxID=71139 RepID=A0ACC3KMX1_EUCGR|nr:hypothetical protein EUGRSUZ_F03354 [Eucalyptus grandis]